MGQGNTVLAHWYLDAITAAITIFRECEPLKSDASATFYVKIFLYLHIIHLSCGFTVLLKSFI
jgi:hypothetical protein